MEASSNMKSMTKRKRKKKKAKRKVPKYPEAGDRLLSKADFEAYYDSLQFADDDN